MRLLAARDKKLDSLSIHPLIVGRGLQLIQWVRNRKSGSGVSPLFEPFKFTRTLLPRFARESGETPLPLIARRRHTARRWEDERLIFKRNGLLRELLTPDILTQ